MRILSIVLAMLLGACAQDSSANKTNKPEPEELRPGAASLTPPPPSEHNLKASKPTMLTLRGTVVYKNLEGGFFGFNADNGKKYLPNGLKKEYQRHGLILEVTGEINTQMVTFQQYGSVLMIKSVKVIDDTKISSNKGDVM